jgi:dihydrofolate synthase/folylpolyglutamate synthase
VDEIAGIHFPRAASVILTQPRQSRALSAEMLARLTLHLAPRAEVVPDSTAALRHALQSAAPDDVVFAAGSLYLVGELRAAWPGLKPGEAPC